MHQSRWTAELVATTSHLAMARAGQRDHITANLRSNQSCRRKPNIWMLLVASTGGMATASVLPNQRRYTRIIEQRNADIHVFVLTGVRFKLNR